MFLAQLSSRTIKFCCFYWENTLLQQLGLSWKADSLWRVSFFHELNTALYSLHMVTTRSHDSRGQTVCHTDKTTRSLITMLVWRFVKGKLQRLPLSTDLPQWPSCSGNSISGFCGVDWQRL